MAKRKKSDASVQQARRGILITIGVVVLVVVGYGLVNVFSTSTDTPYVALDVPDRDGPIEVTEFFSYACIHCKTFDDLIEDWRQGLPEDVRFRRVHVAFNPESLLLARAYTTLLHHGALEENHTRIFRAIHDRGRRFIDSNDIADFVHGYGIDRATFQTTIESDRVNRMVRDGAGEFESAGLSGFPAFVVNGKYIMNTGVPRPNVLANIDALVTELKSGNPTGT